MDYEAVYTIDLTAYGMPEKELVLSAPTFGRKVAARNASTAKAKVSRNGKETSLTDIGAADQEIIGLLAYVERAPFQVTLQGFMGFMDRLDSVKKGNADHLWDEIIADIRRIAEGNDGPFAGSQQAETEISE